MYKGPLTRTEIEGLLYGLDRLAAQDIGGGDRYHLGKIRGLALYFLMTAREEQHSVRVPSERVALRIVDEIETIS